ncbi:MAG: hypothetical protein Q4P65_02565 [Eubacteriales bacterium]|nr:hypothetical protein [Eubacteriales bacterium]
MEKLRSLLKKEINIRENRAIPAWLIALLVFVLILGLLLFSPKLFKTANEGRNAEQLPSGKRIYGESAAVVTARQTGVFAQPDRRELRLCSLIYNEVVEVLDQSSGRFWKVRLPSGLEAYVEAEDLSLDTDCVEPELAYYRALVIGREKRLFSHAKKGELLQIVPLGASLYADYRSADLLRIRLPNGRSAWASTDDLELTSVNESKQLTRTEALSRFRTSLMAFHSAPYLPGQMTIDGIDLPGAVKLSAKLCGLDLPRRLEDLMNFKEHITIGKDAETGLPDFKQLQPGDLLFFRTYDGAGKETFLLAVLMDDEIVLMAKSNSSIIGLWDLSNDSEQKKNLAFAIRLFEDWQD